MSVINMERKIINADNIGQALQKPGWIYRHVVLDRSLSGVPLETIQQFHEKIAKHVESVLIRTIGFHDYVDVILSGLCSHHAISLKKLNVMDLSASGATLGDAVLSALRQAPTLEELRMTCVQFSSPEIVEQFFATTRTLRILDLDNVKVVGDQTTTRAVALAFRQGLQRNRSLMSISLSLITDDRLLRECLDGISRNCQVQKVSLDRLFSAWSSNQTLAVLRSLFAETKSIKKIHYRGGAVLDEFFLGLACTSSVQEIDFEVKSLQLTLPQVDSSIARAIRECCAKNKTLQICKIRTCNGGCLGPRSKEALATGISQLESLTLLSASGRVVSANVLQHVAKLQSASFSRLKRPDWELLSRDPQNSKLQMLDLSRNALTAQCLAALLPCIACVRELSLRDCGITTESTPLLCDFIRNTPLKKLSLGWNPIGSQGAERVLDAVSSCTSMERLDMAGHKNPEGDVRIIDFNECHESLGRLLIDSQLLVLDLRHNCALDRISISSLAAGLRRENVLLKVIKLPWLDLKFIAVLGEALTRNLSLEYLVACDKNPEFDYIFEELEAAEEDAMISFCGMMPKMKSLTCIDFLFDFKLSERLTTALVAALKEYTVLNEIQGNRNLIRKCVDHISNNETIQFYLELNRMGRHHYLSAPETKPVPIGVLPHFFARMTQPEYSSHLFYFLRQTPPDLLVGQDAH